MSYETACLNCGNAITFTFPPEFSKILGSPCLDGCTESSELKCTDCHKKTTIYWCTGHRGVGGISGEEKYD